MEKSKRIADSGVECVCCAGRSFEISIGMLQCSGCGAAYTIPEMDDLRIQLIRDTVPTSISKTYNGYQGVDYGYVFNINLKDKTICIRLANWKKAAAAMESISQIIEKNMVEAQQ